jgi:hypothetical protein
MFMQTVNDNLWIFLMARKNKYYHMKSKIFTNETRTHPVPVILDHPGIVPVAG